MKPYLPNLADSLFEQATTITKAAAYDILLKQVGELKAENERLKEMIKARDERIDEIFKITDKFLKDTINNIP